MSKLTQVLRKPLSWAAELPRPEAAPPVPLAVSGERNVEARVVVSGGVIQWDLFLTPRQARRSPQQC